MKKMRVNTMYGVDNRLLTSNFQGDAAKAARKNLKAFNKSLAKYDKDFINYASMDIDSAKLDDKNTRYILGKLGIAEKYVDYIPTDDISESLGNELSAVAGHKSMPKMGVGAKIASQFQPFFEKQSAKHPKLQFLSDNVTKAANNGRMPLTADSASVMRIAFDKKYYNDIREPGADADKLKFQHDNAIRNLTSMAKFDGVDEKLLSDTFAKKLITQMQVDESITDIYKGMANGDIRLGEVQPMLDKNGKEFKVGGTKSLYEMPTNFVAAGAESENGKYPSLNAWKFEIREPQSIDEILADYKSKLDAYSKQCHSESDLKKMLASDSYANIERNAAAFAEADCPDEAEKFKYEFTRANIASCKQWGIENHNSTYANLAIPSDFDTVTEKSKFLRNYSTSDYYDFDSVHEKAAEEVLYLSNSDLDKSMTQDVTEKYPNATDISALMEKFNKLEAENAELREKLELSDSQEIMHSQSTVIEKSNKSKTEKFNAFENIAAGVSAATGLVNYLRDSYGVKDKTTVSTSSIDDLIQKSKNQRHIETTFEAPAYVDTVYSDVTSDVISEIDTSVQKAIGATKQPALPVKYDAERFESASESISTYNDSIGDDEEYE